MKIKVLEYSETPTIPPITEIIDSSTPVHKANPMPKLTPKILKQWIPLNRILNCKSISCITYKMIKEHLSQLSKINKNDVILIPRDYQLGNYSDAILTIVCANSDNCNVCLKLLDHLSCHKRHCDCNNYKEICRQQLSLRQTVETHSQSDYFFNKYNTQHCSARTKEKIKSLGKYHREAVQGLNNSTQITSTRSNSVKNKNYIDLSSQTLKPYKFYYESIDSSSDESDSDDPFTFCNACTDSSSLSDSKAFLNSDSDLSVADQLWRHNINYGKLKNSSNSHIDFDDSSSVDSNSNMSISNTDDSENNCSDERTTAYERGYNTNNTTDDNEHSTLSSNRSSRNATHDRISIFSDESFVDDGCNSSDDFTKSCNSNKRRYSIITTPIFSDECPIGDSDDDDDDDGFNFTDDTPSNLNPDSQLTSSDDDCLHDYGNRINLDLGNGFMSDSSSLDDGSGVIIVDVTDKATPELHKFVDSSSINRRGHDSSVISSESSLQSIQEHSLNSRHCKIDDSDSIRDASTPNSHEIFQNLDVCKPAYKKSLNKRRRPVKKKPNYPKTESKQRRGLQNSSKLKNKPHVSDIDKQSGPSTSGTTIQRNFSSNINKPNIHNAKSSPLGDINYSYVRNVLSQQNSQAKCITPIEKKKILMKKRSPAKKKKKLKLYDSTTWIESTNYFELCSTNTKR